MTRIRYVCPKCKRLSRRVIPPPPGDLCRACKRLHNTDHRDRAIRQAICVLSRDMQTVKAAYLVARCMGMGRGTVLNINYDNRDPGLDVHAPPPPKRSYFCQSCGMGLNLNGKAFADQDEADLCCKGTLPGMTSATCTGDGNRSCTVAAKYHECMMRGKLPAWMGG